MGVDVNLYAETTATDEQLEAARYLFRRSPIADDYTREDGLGWSCLEFDEDNERVVANVTQRYYGKGYERGDWPSIYGAIRLLQAAFPGARVCYGGDTDDDAPEATPEALDALWAHYLSPKGDEYRIRWDT